MQACGTGLNLQVLPTRRGTKPHVASVEEEGGLAMENSASTLSLCQVGPQAAGCMPAGCTPANLASWGILQG